MFSFSSSCPCGIQRVLCSLAEGESCPTEGATELSTHRLSAVSGVAYGTARVATRPPYQKSTEASLFLSNANPLTISHDLHFGSLFRKRLKINTKMRLQNVRLVREVDYLESLGFSLVGGDRLTLDTPSQARECGITECGHPVLLPFLASRTGGWAKGNIH